MEIKDYIQNERADKLDRISWAVDIISMRFHKFRSDILSKTTTFEGSNTLKI